MSLRPWPDRWPTQEANHFNPAYCGVLIYEFARAYERAKKVPPSFALLFCALPIALHPATRNRLPRSIRTRLLPWLEANRDVRVGFPERARNLTPYVREALRYAAGRRALRFSAGGLIGTGTTRASFTPRARDAATADVRETVDAIQTIGRWFAASGDPSTILAAWGGTRVSFILRSVSIYGPTGECRTVTFHSSGLNILTGRAKTGKSSILDILDYCFGRPECYVAEGVIRQHVTWFGVEIANADDVLFIGRRNPGPRKTTSPDIYVRRGRYDHLPQHADLQQNTTQEGLVRLLTRFAGIAENENRPLHGTRRPLQATIRHALFLCFQKQDEIASRDRLFHRQGEQFIPQAIKDTIPYFLGAVDEQHLLRQNQLDEATRALSRLEVRRDASGSDDGRIRAGIRRVLQDARRVGLIDEDFEPSDVELALAELRQAMAADLRSPTIVTGSSQVIQRLEDELSTLQRQLEEVRNDIRATRHFIREQTGFSSEVSEQRVRLVSLDLYSGVSDRNEVCPLCEANLETPTPAASELSEALGALDEQLEAVAAERPHLQERLSELDKKRREIEGAIVVGQRDLEGAYADDEKARLQRDGVIERARVVGRIGAFLDETGQSNERADLETLIDQARLEVAMLAESVSAEEVEETVHTFVNLIADYMTAYASSLDLEHTEGRIRLDLKRLSVVADTPAGPIHLSRIGSGENWVGYHVVTLLALHRWFREQRRPVPGILVLDQPSQAHYPPEAEAHGRTDGLQDADRRAVRKLFEFMDSASRAIGDGFQLIVLDHAHLDEDWFHAAVVEEWRRGAALVPVGWTKVC